MRGDDRAAIAKCSPFNSSKFRSRTKYGGARERIVAEPFQHTRTASLCASILFVFFMPLVYLWRLVYSDFVKKCLIFLLQYDFKTISAMRSFDSVCIFEIALYFYVLGECSVSSCSVAFSLPGLVCTLNWFTSYTTIVKLVSILYTLCLPRVLRSFFNSLDQALVYIAPHVLVYLTDHWWTWWRCFHLHQLLTVSCM